MSACGGAVGPWLTRPVSGQGRCAGSASLRDGPRAALDREPRRPCRDAPTGRRGTASRHPAGDGPTGPGRREDHRGHQQHHHPRSAPAPRRAACRRRDRGAGGVPALREPVHRSGHGERGRRRGRDTGEPGPRDTASCGRRGWRPRGLRVMFEVIVGRRLSGQLEAVVAPPVQRYVRAARGAGGAALVLWSLRLCFLADHVMEVAAVVRSATGSGRWPPASSTPRTGGAAWCSGSCDHRASRAEPRRAGRRRGVSTRRGGCGQRARCEGGAASGHADRRRAPATRHPGGGSGDVGLAGRGGADAAPDRRRPRDRLHADPGHGGRGAARARRPTASSSSPPEWTSSKRQWLAAALAALAEQVQRASLPDATGRLFPALPKPALTWWRGRAGCPIRRMNPAAATPRRVFTAPTRCEAAVVAARWCSSSGRRRRWWWR